MARISSRRSAHDAPRATRAKTKTISYAEPSSSSSEDNDSDSDAPSASSRRITNTRRSPRKRQAQNYERPAQLRQFQEYQHSDDESQQQQPAQKKQKRSRAKPSRITRSTKKPRRLKNMRSSKLASFTPIISSGVVPPWQTLPYQVLVQILEYAACPFYDINTLQPTLSQRLLLDMSRMCRAFAEPALTVLYSSPPLIPMIHAHQLVEAIKEDPDSRSMSYRRKIKSLCIDVGHVLAYTLPGYGHLDLYNLIKDLPLLADLELYHRKDMSPFRDLDTNIKWTYPENIFEALEYVNPQADASKGEKTEVCKLRSWRWSSRLAGKTWPIEKLIDVHLKPSFSGLTKIAFVNYQIPSIGKNEEDPNHEKILCYSLKPLQNLDHLILESSTLVNSKFLPMLPKTLRRLELINCWEVNADDFAEFLVTHGRHFRELILNHNTSLSMSFLPVLGTACPDLKIFKMNLTYYNIHATYHDSEPVYEKLLFPGQVPHWPSKLQVIELIQLRKWETEAAEMFFQSLLDSAATLPDLRHLTIQSILNIGWRDRASFRDKWLGSIENVFKRVSTPPKWHPTIKPQTELKVRIDSKPEIIVPVHQPQNEAQHRNSSASSSSTPQNSPEVPSTRRSQRNCARQSKTNAYVESPDTSDAEKPKDLSFAPKDTSRHANRLTRELNILKQTAGIDGPDAGPLSSLTGTDLSDSDDAPLPIKSKPKDEQVIQGMCEVVDLRIDNLRPAERQVTEADFLDEEASGDDDWNGEDPEEQY